MTATSPSSATDAERGPEPSSRSQSCGLVDESVEVAGVGGRRRPMGVEDAIEVRGQLGRPFAVSVGVAMTIIGGSANSGPSSPKHAAIASLPPCTPRASPSV